MATSIPLYDHLANSTTKTESSIKSTLPPPAPEWGTDSVSIKDFATKRTVPGFAKITKGNYMTLGSSKFSIQKQHHEVFIHSLKVAVKVLAHSVRKVEATTASKRGGHRVVTRMYAMDQRLAIPISYQGWFELLSEDGKSARPIASVHELSKVMPKRVLVRENMKAYIIHDESRLTFDNTKIVIAGEHLVINGHLSLPSSDETKKVKLLRCFDSKGERVYLSFDQKGIFTQIAGENDLNGVFLIRDVVRRFRLPLTVKLVQGMRPKVDPTRFTGLVRLDWVYTDETAFVCPIEKNQIRLLPVPTDANLQFVSAVNQEAMKSTDLYETMIIKCNRMIANYNNTIHLIVNLPPAASKARKKSNSNVFSMPLTNDTEHPLTSKSAAKQKRLMDEIDDLYGYVRDGGAIPHKFQYDSDEESFWEEPAYEPLDDFRARLNAIEAGEKVTYHSKYQPQDFGRLDIWGDSPKETDSTYGVLNGTPLVPEVSCGKTFPPPLPPRQPDLPPTPPMSPPPDIARSRQSLELLSKEMDLVTRRRKSDGPVTSVSSHGLVSSHQLQHDNRKRAEAQRQNSRGSVEYQRRHSRESVEYQRRRSRGSVEYQRRHSRGSGDPSSPQKETSSNSDSSGQGYQRMLARDFKDSDISSVTKGSSNSSGGAVGSARRKLQTLYL